MLVITSKGSMALGARAQEPAPKRVDGSGATSVSNDGKPATARHLPDELKFANGLLRQRKYDLAADEYERFLKSGASGQDADDARFGLGNARLYQSRYQQALAAFGEFLKAAPNDPRALTARYRVGELKYLVGDLTGARQALEAYTAIKVDHPGLEMAWAYLGDACFGLGDFAAARGAYERSLAVYPRGRMSSRARYGLGRTLGELRERDRALEVLRELVKLGQPDWLDRAWLQIGLICRSAGQFREAVEAFSNVEQRAPASPLRVEAQLNHALALAALERVGEAEALLQSVASDAASPVAPRAALELATIQLENNRARAALATLEDALRRFPKSSSAVALSFRTAEALEKQNRPAEALAQYLKTMELDPKDPWADDAMHRAARLALEGGDPARARELAGRFAARFPQSPLGAEVRLVEGRAAALEGKPKEAIAILEPLLAAPSDSPSKGTMVLPPAAVLAAQYELALAYRAAGQPDRAEPLLARLAQAAKGPVSADAQFMLGQSHLDAGRFADAIAPLEQYLAANSKGDVVDFAMAHLAMAKLGLGQTAEAGKLLTELAERLPDSRALPPARLRLAEAMLTAHQAERAAEQFRLAAGVDAPAGKPAEGGSAEKAIRVRALTGLGRALTELGKPADAAKAFATALELAGNGSIAVEIALAQARALDVSGQSEAALNAYRLIGERYPKTGQAAQAALAQARLLSKAGRHGDAVQAFAGLDADPDAQKLLEAAGVTRDTVLAEWGYALLDADRPADADHVFARLLHEFPDGSFAADARFNLAESANQKHDLAEVIRLLGPLATVKLSGDRAAKLLPAALYRLGRTQVEVKDWAAAQATLNRLLADFPDCPYRRESRFLCAEAALRQGDAASAEAGFTALVTEGNAASDPAGMLATAKLKQIQCWVALKRWKDALDAATSAAAELKAGDPAKAELDYARGQALLGMGRLDDARAAFQKVLDARRTGELAAQAQLMCGETFFHQDQFHEALREFLKVDILYKAPHWQASALLEAGKVYERLDQWADAAEIYERLLARFPNDPVAEDARKRRDETTRRATANQSSKKS
jgi:cellulose synthase operon protein C